MEPVFQFLGNFWWLIFPLMGVIGWVGSAWERGARHRHKRRLEIIRAKSELKAAQTAARTSPVPVTGGEASRGGGRPRSHADQLEKLFDAHDAITGRWLEYELDVAKLIAFPNMSDGRQPLTAAFLRAKKVADGLRPESAKAKISKDALAEYRAAVTDYEVAFDVAERDARRAKDSSFSPTEKKRLDTAKQLLTVAIDQAATPAERHLAYRRVRDELDGLILLSDDAIEVLEKKVSLQLPQTGSMPAAGAESSDAASRPPQASPPSSPPSNASGTAASGSGSPDSGSAGSGSTGAGSSGAGSSGAAPQRWPVPARGETAPGRVVRPKPPRP